ncbi:SemiSWEET family transporter [Lactobacillus sp.]|uniref:SemiSWEET family transporter n=1 Tax=Lactobacillus sp. TaxID=1591 RepID=UPI003EF61C50
MNNSKLARLVGRVASVMSIAMYVSYLPQIANNLHRQYGNPVQPLVACINSVFWCAYALLQTYKDWPVFIANLPGIIFALITFITALH